MSKEYIHEAQYYETDQMGIVHHSNYIRWMEEARVHMLDDMGFGYRRLEDMGVMSPVLKITCEYKKTVKFGDKVSIEAYVIETNGIKVKIGYRMTNLTTNEECTLGTSEHCFMHKSGKIMSVKKEMPEFYEAMLQAKSFD